MAVRACGVTVPESPGPIPTTCSSPRGDPTDSASMGAGPPRDSRRSHASTSSSRRRERRAVRPRQAPRPPPRRGSRPPGKTRSRRVAQPPRLRFQCGRVEEPGRDAESLGHGVQRGLVRLQVDGEDARHRLGSEPRRVQAGPGQRANLLRRGTRVRTRCRLRAAAVGRSAYPARPPRSRRRPEW